MIEIDINGNTISDKRRSLTDRIKKTGREAHLVWEEQAHQRIRVTLPPKTRKGESVVTFFRYDEPELVAWLILNHPDKQIKENV